MSTYSQRLRNGAPVRRCVFCWQVRESEPADQLFTYGQRVISKVGRGHVQTRNFLVHQTCLNNWLRAQRLIQAGAFRKNLPELLASQGKKLDSNLQMLFTTAEKFFWHLQRMKFVDLTKCSDYLTFIRS
jgi:hypothetical protein